VIEPDASTRPTFVGADATAASALADAVDAVVRFHASTDRLEQELERCAAFAVGHAYAAHLHAFTGTTRATASTTPANRHELPRRERQLVEILLLAAQSQHQRAAYLAAEHVAEFPEDRDALVLVDRWSRQRGEAG
jgi:hypothetical protein